MGIPADIDSDEYLTRYVDGDELPKIYINAIESLLESDPGVFKRYNKIVKEKSLEENHFNEEYNTASSKVKTQISTLTAENFDVKQDEDPFTKVDLDEFDELFTKYIDGELDEKDQLWVKELISKNPVYLDQYELILRTKTQASNLFNSDYTSANETVKNDITNLVGNIMSEPKGGNVVEFFKKRSLNINFVASRLLPIAAAFAFGLILSPDLIKQYGTKKTLDGQITLRGGSNELNAKSLRNSPVEIFQDQKQAFPKIDPLRPFVISITTQNSGKLYVYAQTITNDNISDLVKGELIFEKNVSGNGSKVSFEANVDANDKFIRIDLELTSETGTETFTKIIATASR